MTATPPRLFGITATKAPVVAVLRRGPTDWWHLWKWDLSDQPSFEPGAWFHGALYPQKCDLSPDGRWFAYSARKEGSDWAAGSIYEAISRLPWLTALVAWGAGTTYTRGIHFSNNRGVTEIGEPDVGEAGPCLERFGIRITQPMQFSVEHRRGWAEAPGTPTREAGGPWDENREVEMGKTQPGGDVSLRVSGAYAAFRDLPDTREPAKYSLVADDEHQLLDDVQWADWDAGGRLLVATQRGSLQIRSVDRFEQALVFQQDLSKLSPDPQPPPRWAEEW